MLEKHVVCDGCGAVTLDASFENSVYGDTEGTFPYDTIVSDGERLVRQITGTDWVKHGFRDPDDPIAINFEDYCPDCKQDV